MKMLNKGIKSWSWKYSQGESLLRQIMKGKAEGRRGRVKIRIGMLSDVTERKW